MCSPSSRIGLGLPCRKAARSRGLAEDRRPQQHEQADVDAKAQSALLVDKLREPRARDVMDGDILARRATAFSDPDKIVRAQ